MSILFGKQEKSEPSSYRYGKHLGILMHLRVDITRDYIRIQALNIDTVRDTMIPAPSTAVMQKLIEKNHKVSTSVYVQHYGALSLQNLE